jgi:hypothetical protein
MKLYLGTPGFGWTMYGLIGKGAKWFLGFSKALEGNKMTEEQAKGTTQEYVKLRCCGNCKHFTLGSCPLRKEVKKEFCAFPEPDETCDNWKYDGRSHKERMVV